MAISEKRFLAILSMDAYNRGGNRGIESAALSGREIGKATVGLASNSAVTSDELKASFFAQSYAWNGKTVISYRGTDTGTPAGFSSDAWNGWGLAGGKPFGPQAKLDAQFYNAVNNIQAGRSSNVVLIGQSLAAGAMQ